GADRSRHRVRLQVRGAGRGREGPQVRRAAGRYFAARSASTCATNSAESGSTFEGKLSALRASREMRYLWKFHSGRWLVACISPSNTAEPPGSFTDVFANIGNLTA